MIEADTRKKVPYITNGIYIKPCPCCGGENVEIKTPMARYFKFYYVACECGIRTIDFPVLEEAIKVWNNR